jgi:phosphoglycolate phosphatase-like HAD superfamily hydrolase
MKQPGNKIILFDMDRTLLNTELYEKRTYTMVAELMNVEYSMIEQFIADYMRSLTATNYYDFYELLGKISPSADVYQNIVFEYENNRFLYPKYLDVIPTLKLLCEKGYKIGIFSEGIPQTQYNKLKNLRISEYLTNDLIYMVRSKRQDELLDRIPDSTYIVDDKLDVIEFLAEKKRFRPIHLLRNSLIDQDMVYETDYVTIRTLTDLRGFLTILEDKK